MRRATRYLLPSTAIVLGLALLLAVGLVKRPQSTPSRYIGDGPPPGAYRGSEPPGKIHLPQFALRDVDGRIIRSTNLRGSVILITFLDTKCRSKCPLLASEIGDALRLLSTADLRRARALAISVEPKTDTPRSVRKFLRERNARAIDFLIGPRPRLIRAWRAFHIIAAAETGNADVHSADVRVFDRAGIWVSTLHAGVDLTPANLAHDIRTAATP